MVLELRLAKKKKNLLTQISWKVHVLQKMDKKNN